MLPWEVRAMRRAAEAWRISGDGLIPVLAVTAACFLLGGLVGCLLASHIGGGGQESLAAYVEGFLRAAQACLLYTSDAADE